MNLKEMIQHLKIAEAILDHMANTTDPESSTSTGYFKAAENIGWLIEDLERLNSALKMMTEATKPAEQPAPTDKGFTLPPYSFPPMDTKTITDPLKPPTSLVISRINVLSSRGLVTRFQKTKPNRLTLSDSIGAKPKHECRNDR